MASFQYKAIAPGGKVINDVMDAASESDVTKMIFSKGYRPINITKVKGDKESSEGSGEIQFFKKKVKTEQIVLFTRELVTLLKAGVPMLTAIEALAAQSSKEMGEILDKVYVAVMSGKSFSQALREHPKVFPLLYVNSVYAGEMSGSLDEVLERMVAVLSKDEETKKKVKGAMQYPIFVVVAMVIAFYVLLTQVVPKFADIFAGMNMELPIFTKILIALSEMGQKYGLVIIGMLGVGGALFKYYTSTEKGRLWWDTTVMKVPVIGDLVKKSSMARFTKMFETLNKSGLPILQTLDTVSKAVGNKAIEISLRNVALGVEKGQGISGSLKKENLFPPMVIRMISIGEQSGSLDEMLGSVAQHYDMEVEHAIKALTSMIEPVLTVVIGGAVVVMAFGIFLPMWGMVGAVQ
ncbi:type II secretion system F family protein [bacterium]|nr:type II secretion system F family protein [bacterium]